MYNVFHVWVLTKLTLHASHSSWGALSFVLRDPCLTCSVSRSVLRVRSVPSTLARLWRPPARTVTAPLIRNRAKTLFRCLLDTKRPCCDAVISRWDGVQRVCNKEIQLTNSTSPSAHTPSSSSFPMPSFAGVRISYLRWSPGHQWPSTCAPSLRSRPAQVHGVWTEPQLQKMSHSSPPRFSRFGGAATTEMAPRHLRCNSHWDRRRRTAFGQISSRVEYQRLPLQLSPWNAYNNPQLPGWCLASASMSA